MVPGGTRDRTLQTCEEVQPGPRRLQEGPGGTRDRIGQQTPEGSVVRYTCEKVGQSYSGRRGGG